MKLHFPTSISVSVLTSLILTSAAFALPLGGAFDNRGNETEAQMRVAAGSQATTERTRFKSLKVENEIFEVIFIPASNNSKIAVLSDDGVTVTINGTGTNVTNAGKPQAGPNLQESLHLVNASFQAGRAYQIKIDYSNTIYSGETDYDGLTLFAYNGGGRVQEVNLIISQGQDGFVVPDDDEESVGAFTVANRNDTDGDGIIDNSDNNVVATANGNNEVDLMSLEISKPAGAPTDKLTVKVTNGSGRLWLTGTKGTAVPLVNGAAEFALSTLPRTIYLEATTTSQTLRSLTVELDYKGYKDTVKATGVWATATATAHDTQSAAALFAQPTWQNTTIPPRNTIVSLGGVGLRPIDPVYGVANVILIQFSLLPSGIGSQAGVNFDATRKVEVKGWIQNITTAAVEFESRNFPALDELPNDDNSSTDESSSPLNDRFYVYDRPGVRTDQAATDLLILRLNAAEFMRVSFTGSRPAGNFISGSRCSDKLRWHARHRLDKIVINGQPKWARAGGDAPESDDNDVGLGFINIGTGP